MSFEVYYVVDKTQKCLSKCTQDFSACAISSVYNVGH